MLQDLYQGAGKLDVRRDEWDIVEVHYWRGKKSVPNAATVHIVLASNLSDQRLSLKFKGVRPAAFPLLATADTVEIINQHLRQYEGPDQVAVWLVSEDGSREMAFSAQAVNEAKID